MRHRRCGVVPAMASDVKHFTYTKDPADPCAYCVQWESPEGVDEADDPFMEQAIPMMPTYCVLRVYRGIHKACDDAMEEYANTDTR